MGKAFEACFFHFPSPVKPVLTLPGTPAPKCPFYPVMKDEVEHALKGTSNKSAPGPSGINYKLVKWAFSAHPEFILNIYNAALHLGHHPWTAAKVVIIPKPNKPDYSTAKAYRPISLLECFGKVLEKVVANHFTSDCNLHNILPPSQFGSWPYHSVMDACTLLWYKASMTINSGHIRGTLLFDISRFFNHLDPSFTAQVLHHLGIDDHTIEWVRDFMTRREITMLFNNYTTNDIYPNLGTPQGSPLSPILSALVTGPILRLAEAWDNTDLTLYVDNGNIFASSPTYQATTDKLTKAVTSLENARRL
jgi:retron-type reverse transcriptase